MPEYVDHVVVVDDCSVDDTSNVALATGDRRLIALKTPLNQGVGGATLFGYGKALEIDSDIVVKIDGDGQMAPEYMLSLLDALIEQGYDYAKGNRFLASESLAFMPRHRLFGNVVLTFMTKLASGYWHLLVSLNRLFLQLYPSLLFVYFLIVRTPEEALMRKDSQLAAATLG